MGKGDTCDVCGGSETRLVDGFYYCAECGTQDTNVRETVIEHTTLGDGTFAFVSKQKYSVKIKDGAQMSPEWYKWHAYNFIMAGLTDELLRLGAAPSVKMKVFWIWAKYIKKYQNKEQMFSNIMSEIRDETKDTEHSDNEQQPQNKIEMDMTHNIIVTILNFALNLDKSEFQLSHLRRFILNGHLGIDKCKEYVPKEINTKAIRGWMWTLTNTKSGCFTRDRLTSAMKRCMALDLGPYMIPNIEMMIDNHLKELSLPNELKQLVLSLMDYAPIDFLNRDKKSQALPDFEGLVMSYIIVSLKMCFGLDDDYEQRLSEAVEKINDKENHLKAYRLDVFAEVSDRLFSFREWCNYLLFRKYMHCNYNSGIARERGIFLDDYVFMEHSKPETKEVLLSDEVTMDIINKIPQENDFAVIPMAKFEPSVTPLSTLTEVICQHLRDLDKRMLLSEDFTQYSINYACRDLALPSANLEISENIIHGVSESGKTYKEHLGLHFTSSYSDGTVVYVRNCENKNWFKTKRPTADHIIKVKESSDKDSDLGYDSNLENTVNSNTNEIKEETTQDAIDTENKSVNIDANTSVNDDDESTKDTKLEVFEEDKGDNIFDDDFLDINTEENKFADTVQNFDSTFNDTMATVNFEDEENNIEDSKVGLQSISIIDGDVEPNPKFDPTTFDRESTIKELVIAACRKYKAPIPYKFRMQGAKKRKLEDPNIKAGEPKHKRARTRPDEEKIIEINEHKAKVSEIVTTYYCSLEHDILHEVSQHVKSFVDNMAHQNTTNDSIDQNQNEVGTENNDLDQSDQLIVKEHSEIDEDESDDGSTQDPVYKGDPKYDEKTHDSKQLYLKVKGEFEITDLFDLDSDEEINKLLEEQINNPSKPVDKDNSGDDSEDMPLSRLCKPKTKRKKKLERLIPNAGSIGTFNYWFKHYISRVFKKHDLTERFDAEIRDTFPKSFGFVLFECAAILDCSAYSLYRHVTDIEEKMLKKDGYIRPMKSLKDTGIQIERRDYETRKTRERRKSRGKEII